jgi:hypothetical protein
MTAVCFTISPPFVGFSHKRQSVPPRAFAYFHVLSELQEERGASTFSEYPPQIVSIHKCLMVDDEDHHPY